MHNNQKNKPAKVAGFKPVLFALVGNGFITVIKFIGFFISGSGALFSESVHSFADTANQGLLLAGIKKSQKKANEEFSYGFGQERFIWALISACGIFFIGSGITVYHGIQTLFAEEKAHISPLIFVILVVSFIIEIFTLWKAWQELREKHNNLKEILAEGDPASVAVLFEDGVAVLGVIIALISIALTFFTGNPVWDSIGSIIIGILLGWVAVVLINKNRKLLMEKAMPEEIKEKVIEILEADPAIEKILDFKSATLDSAVYRIKCEIEFNGSALLKETHKSHSLRNQHQLIKDDFQEFLKFCAEYIDRVPRLMGKKIDAIEKKIQKEIPEIRHIDIEIN